MWRRSTRACPTHSAPGRRPPAPACIRIPVRREAEIRECGSVGASRRARAAGLEIHLLGNSPRTVLEEVARIQSHDVVVPTAAYGQTRLRRVTPPDAAQAALLGRLGVVLPKRMRLAEAELPTMPSSA